MPVYKVGDLVRVPRSESQDEGLKSLLGIVVGIDPHRRGLKDGLRVNVWWFADKEMSWEPPKWLGVVNESR